MGVRCAFSLRINEPVTLESVQPAIGLNGRKSTPPFGVFGAPQTALENARAKYVFHWAYS